MKTMKILVKKVLPEKSLEIGVSFHQSLHLGDVVGITALFESTAAVRGGWTETNYNDSLGDRRRKGSDGTQPDPNLNDRI